MREIRRKLGLTQADMAKILGIAHETVGRKERGQLAINPAEKLALLKLSESIFQP